RASVQRGESASPCGLPASDELRERLRRALEGDGARTWQVGRRVDQRAEGQRDAEDADQLGRLGRAPGRERARRRARLDDGPGQIAAWVHRAGRVAAAEGA